MVARPRVRTPDELAKALRKARTKSDEQARHGNLPHLIEARPDGSRLWHVLSRTIAGLVYEVAESRDGDLACDCQALGWCWHRTHAERASAGEIGHFTDPRVGREAGRG
jgi:hypothetical protein